jgi:2-methylcitrate dehydratase PrpD
MMDKTISQQIATAFSDVKLNDLPRGVREKCAQSIIDTVGLTIAALETDYGIATRQAFDDDGCATVFGLDRGFSPDSAAIINGTCGHGEDFDNTFEGCPVHTGVVLVPALLAAMERYGFSSDRAAIGLATGIETMCRLGIVANKYVHSAGFHPTGVIGAIAAAVGVSVARKLNEKQIVNAMGVAGSMASGIIEYLADGSSTKRLHPGWAAHCGIRASAMGGAGFSGPVSVFEGEHGFFHAFANRTDIDFAPLIEDLGKDWATCHLAFKPFACGTMTQPYVDCAIELAKKVVDLETIESIECEVGEGTVHRLWAPSETKQSPPTAYAAKFSGPYCVASGLYYRDAGLSEFTDVAVQNPDVLKIARKVTYVIDPLNPYPKNYTGHIRLKLRSGNVLEARSPCLRGGAQAPMSTSEIIDKCKANIEFSGRDISGANVIADFSERLMGGDSSASVSILRRAGT